MILIELEYFLSKLEPKMPGNDGIIMEFNAFDYRKEKSLEETVQSTLNQIEKKNYEAALRTKGIFNIRKYCFCFEGKEVLIVKG